MNCLKVKIVKNPALFLHIHNAQTKGTDCKSMVKSVHKERWLHLQDNWQHCKCFGLKEALS